MLEKDSDYLLSYLHNFFHLLVKRGDRSGARERRSLNCCFNLRSAGDGLGQTCKAETQSACPT